MPRRFVGLAWTAAACTYLLIVLGAVVRITGSGMGCGDDWPLCHGRILPPLDDPATVIEWAHRQVAGLVSVLVFAVAGYAWWLRRDGGSEMRDASNGPIPSVGPSIRPSVASYVALALLMVQVLLGAVTVKLELPHWTVVLHLATAMLLLAAVLAAAQGWRGLPSRAIALASALGFVTVLLGGMTAKLGAATACLGFPLCNGQLSPDGNYLQHLHWTHRLFGYGLTAYLAVLAVKRGRAGVRVALALVLLQVAVAAAMVLRALPALLQATHVAVGTAVWATLVLVALREPRRAL